MGIAVKSPDVFISYAWDTVESDNWVRCLARDLRENGINAHLDRWKLVAGDELTFFMEQSIKYNQYVIVVCTPKYKYRSENRIGGVGYEGNIITAEILQNANQKKFIPVLQNGDRLTAIPIWLIGKLFIDFTNVLHYENSFDTLMRKLLNLREPEPPLGKIPEKYQQELAALEEIQLIEWNISETLETTVVNETQSIQKQLIWPFLEADLIRHGSSRSPRGYSDKNPKELDENGQYITVIGAGVKPIIFWELGWRFDLVIYNNSSFPAFNIIIESIGEAAFSTLEKLDKVNNLKPFDKIELKATFHDYVEGIHTVADEIVAKKTPTKLNGLILKIFYQAESGDTHVTLMKIQDGKVFNVRE